MGLTISHRITAESTVQSLSDDLMLGMPQYLGGELIHTIWSDDHSSFRIVREDGRKSRQLQDVKGLCKIGDELAFWEPVSGKGWAFNWGSFRSRVFDHYMGCVVNMGGKPFTAGYLKAGQQIARDRETFEVCGIWGHRITRPYSLLEVFSDGRWVEINDEYPRVYASGGHWLSARPDHPPFLLGTFSSDRGRNYVEQGAQVSGPWALAGFVRNTRSPEDGILLVLDEGSNKYSLMRHGEVVSGPHFDIDTELSACIEDLPFCFFRETSEEDPLKVQWGTQVFDWPAGLDAPCWNSFRFRPGVIDIVVLDQEDRRDIAVVTITRD